jgi:hypothetical protein
MESRICTTCKIEKPISEYHRNKTQSCGYNYVCKPCRADYQREYHKKNHNKLKKKRDVYRKSEAGLKVIRKYNKNRRKRDPLFRAKMNLRKRINDCYTVSYWSKKSKNQVVLGCDYDTAFKHIEDQFRDGMSWDNYGEWHIDHIIPLCSATTVEELEKLCHYTNLQPLWAEENISKGGKMPEDLF